MRPLQNEGSTISTNAPNNSEIVAPASTSENDESTAQMTASFHSRTKSLPRTKRREDGSPGPANVAVVSPMPTTPAKSASPATCETSKGSTPAGVAEVKKEEDPLKGLVPLGPLGLFSASRQAAAPGGGMVGSKPTHQLPFSGRMEQLCSGTTLATNSVLTQGKNDLTEK